MAEDLNNVTLTCRLGRDPELRHTASGDPVCSLWVVCNGRKDSDASWFSVTVFGRSAEAAAEYLSKGRKIGVTGRLRSREWEKDGQKRRELEVIANSWTFMDSKSDGQQPTSSAASQSDDEIPF